MLPNVVRERLQSVYSLAPSQLKCIIISWYVHVRQLYLQSANFMQTFTFKVHKCFVWHKSSIRKHEYESITTTTIKFGESLQSHLSSSELHQFSECKTFLFKDFSRMSRSRGPSDFVFMYNNFLWWNNADNIRIPTVTIPCLLFIYNATSISLSPVRNYAVVCFHCGIIAQVFSQQRSRRGHSDFSWVSMCVRHLWKTTLSVWSLSWKIIHLFEWCQLRFWWNMFC